MRSNSQAERSNILRAINSGTQSFGIPNVTFLIHMAIPNDSYYLKRCTGFVPLWEGVKLNGLENDKDGYKIHMSCDDGI